MRIIMAQIIGQALKQMFIGTDLKIIGQYIIQENNMKRFLAILLSLLFTLNVWANYPVTKGGGGIPEWQTGVTYQIDNIVHINEFFYKALTNHISGVFATDLANNEWIEMADNLNREAAASVTDDALTRWDGTDGDNVQNSLAILTDAGAMTGLTALTVDNIQLGVTGTNTLDVTGGGNLTLGNVGATTIIAGDLQVDGTTTTVNSTTLDVDAAKVNVNVDGNQAAANAGNSGIEVNMTDAQNAGLSYDSTLASSFKIGETNDYREVVTVSDTQDLINKEYANTASLNANLVIDMVSTAKSSRPCPIMTEAQRDLLTSVDAGCVFNDDTDKLNVFNGSVWKAVGGGIDPWITATNYAINDVIHESEKIYRALTDHTSGTFATDLGNNEWIELSDDLNREATGTVTDNAIIRWDGTGGDDANNSLILISDLGALSGAISGVFGDIRLGVTSTQTLDTATLNSNLILDGNGTGGVQISGHTTASRPFFTDASGLMTTSAGWTFDDASDTMNILAGQFNLDDMRMDGGTISTTNANGDLTLNPNGTGSVIMSVAGNTYDFGSSGTGQLQVARTDAGAGQLEVYSSAGDSTQATALRIFGSGLPAAANSDFMQMIWDTGNSEYVLESNQNTGTLRAMRLETGANTGQIRLETTGVVSTLDQFSVESGGNPYDMLNRSTALALVNSTAAQDAELEVFSTDGDGTDNSKLKLYGLGTQGSIVNSEWLEMGWDVTKDEMLISSQADGTGTLRQIIMETEGNTDQFRIDTDGSLYTSGDFNVESEGEVRFQDNTGGEYMGFKAPGTVTASTTFTLPDGDGEDGQVLKTDGSGVLSWDSSATSPTSSTISYTPAFVGFGTTTNISFEYQRVGDRLRVNGRFASGSPTAVEARIGLPIIDGNQLLVGSQQGSQRKVGAGVIHTAVATADKNINAIATAGNSYINFGLLHRDLAINPMSELLGTNIGANGLFISFDFEVPIQGWQSSTDVITQAGFKASSIYWSGVTGCQDDITAGTFTTFSNANCTFASADTIGSAVDPTGNDIALEVPTLPPGVYEVSADGKMSVGNVISHTCVFELDDGTNNIGTTSLSTGAGDFQSMNGLKGLIEITSTQTDYKVELKAKRTNGAVVGCSIIASADNSIGISIKPYYGVIQANLDDYVATPGAGQDTTMHSCDVELNSGTPTNGSNSCALWLTSYTDTAAGDVTLNFPASTFPSEPSCVTTIYGQSGNILTAPIVSKSTTTARVRVWDDAVLSDYDFSIICHATN